MFGLFNKKKNDNKDEYDPDKITLDYEGGVMSQGDYEAYTLNRNDPSSYVSSNWIGENNIYKDGDKIIEEYEGNFHVGQYHGQGKLSFRGKIYEGLFVENQFVDEAKISKKSDE